MPTQNNAGTKPNTNIANNTNNTANVKKVQGPGAAVPTNTPQTNTNINTNANTNKGQKPGAPAPQHQNQHPASITGSLQPVPLSTPNANPNPNPNSNVPTTTTTINKTGAKPPVTNPVPLQNPPVFIQGQGQGHKQASNAPPNPSSGNQGQGVQGQGQAHSQQPDHAGQNIISKTPATTTTTVNKKNHPISDVASTSTSSSGHHNPHQNTITNANTNTNQTHTQNQNHPGQGQGQAHTQTQNQNHPGQGQAHPQQKADKKDSVINSFFKRLIQTRRKSKVSDGSGSSSSHAVSILKKDSLTGHEVDEKEALRLKREREKDQKKMGRHSQEILHFNKTAKPYKVISKSHLQNDTGVGHPNNNNNQNGRRKSSLQANQRHGSITNVQTGRKPSHPLKKNIPNKNLKSEVNRKSSWPSAKSKPRIQFHSEDEIKQFIPHVESYKHSTVKHPLGLDIFTHAEHLWLIQNLQPTWSQSIYEYEVYDDSEQKIIQIFPEFASNLRDSLESEVSLVMYETPVEFLCHTAVGREVCLMSFETVPNPDIKSTKTKKAIPYMKLDITIRTIKMGTIEQLGSSIIVKDSQETEIMEAVGVPISVGGCCVSLKRSFQCKVFLKENIRKFFGTVGRNGKTRRKILYGESYGFYFFPAEPTPVPTSPIFALYRLYILGMLIGLTTIYTDLDYSTSL